MTRVCHITSVHPRFDTRVFHREAVSLAQAGYEVYLIVADGKGDQVVNSVNIIDVGKPRSRISRVLNTTKEVCKKAKELGCEIVHFHDPELVHCAYKLKRKHKIKVIYDIHENRPEQVLYKPYLPGFLRPVISKIVELVENWYIKRFDYNIIPDPGTYERVKALNIPHIANVRNYALPVDYFLPWEQKDHAVIYAGLISEVRGIWEMLDMIMLTDAYLYLAGPWDTEELRKRVEKHKAWEKVKYFGILEKQELDKLVAKTKVGLVTLKKTPFYLHNLPRKIFEYMLAGIPMVINDTELWNSIINDCRCGISVDITDTDKFAEAVNYLLHNPHEAMKMGQNGLRTAQQKYNWEKEKEKMLEVYNKILR